MPGGAAELGNVACEGWMNMRRVGLFTSWKRQWFVLSGDRLYYFDHASSASSNGVMLLRDVLPGQVVDAFKHIFVLRYNGQRYQFQCESLADQSRWMEAIADRSSVEILPETLVSVSSSTNGSAASGATAAGSGASPGDAAAASTQVTCQQCRAAVPHARFCRQCGSHLPLNKSYRCPDCSQTVVDKDWAKHRGSTCPRLADASTGRKSTRSQRGSKSSSRGSRRGNGASSKTSGGMRRQRVDSTFSDIRRDDSKDREIAEAAAEFLRDGGPRKPDQMVDEPAMVQFPGMESDTMPEAPVARSTVMGTVPATDDVDHASPAAGGQGVTSDSSYRTRPAASGSIATPDFIDLPPTPLPPRWASALLPEREYSSVFALGGVNDSAWPLSYANSVPDGVPLPSMTDDQVARTQVKRGSSSTGDDDDMDGAGSGRTFCLEGMTQCPKCKQSIALAGLVTDLTCSACGRRVEMLPNIWGGVCEAMERDALTLKENQARNITVRAGKWEARFVYGRKTPACAECQVAIPGVATVAADADAVRVCASCRSDIYVFLVPSWLRIVHPEAKHVIGARARNQCDGLMPGALEAAAAASGTPTLDKPAARLLDTWRSSEKSVAFACSKCSRMIPSSQDTPRGLTCPGCKAKVEMPLHVWQLHHPPSLLTRWYIYFDDTPGPKIAGSAGKRRRRSLKSARKGSTKGVRSSRR